MAYQHQFFEHLSLPGLDITAKDLYCDATFYPGSKIKELTETKYLKGIHDIEKAGGTLSKILRLHVDKDVSPSKINLRNMFPDDALNSIDDGGRRRIRLISRTGGGGGDFSVLKVIHEKGHVSWHLPTNHLKNIKALAPNEDWNYEIPHVEYEGEGDAGPFGVIGEKVFLEITFPFETASNEGELLHHLMGSANTDSSENNIKDPFVDEAKSSKNSLVLAPENLDDPWERAADSLPMKSDTRLLLLVHGTFSSTKGAFSDLWEKNNFLQVFGQNYDHVLGFEHDTVLKSPAENADDLIFELERIRDKTSTKRISVDILCHSRGGLVSRMMLEPNPFLLSDIASDTYDFKNLTMVAVPNQGTQLCDPDGLVDLINFLQNIVKLIPGAAGTVEVIIFGVLKALAHGITSLPGLAPMRPGSAFLLQLNDLPDGRPTSYHVANSDYQPKNWFKQFLHGIYTHHAFRKRNNDLVVPTAGSPLCPEPKRVTKLLLYGKEKHIHHSDFFGQKKTQEFIISTFAN